MLALSQVAAAFSVYDTAPTLILYYLTSLCGSIFRDMIVVALIMLIIKPTRKWVQSHGRLILVVIAVLLAITIVLWVILAMLCGYFAG
ncbi:MAG: hypothetical protein LUD79_01275 [Oscillospiraceae bacterium]|nr:hypothetical protein [Oscillospiraceae bacterium]